jgi:hypothetical protein
VKTGSVDMIDYDHISYGRGGAGRGKTEDSAFLTVGRHAAAASSRGGRAPLTPVAVRGARAPLTPVAVRGARAPLTSAAVRGARAPLTSAAVRGARAPLTSAAVRGGGNSVTATSRGRAPVRTDKTASQGKN